MPRIALGIFVMTLFCIGIGHGAHPLITDDTGTQGKGKFQIEINYEFSHESSGGLRENVHEMETVLSSGIVDTVDLVVGLP